MHMISRGSELHRWEPQIEAIAVTDYYVTDTYEEFVKHKAAGRLPDVKLLFPNMEMRLREKRSDPVDAFDQMIFGCRPLSRRCLRCAS
jgi:hypothetical protein